MWALKMSHRPSRARRTDAGRRAPRLAAFDRSGLSAAVVLLEALAVCRKRERQPSPHVHVAASDSLETRTMTAC